MGAAHLAHSKAHLCHPRCSAGHPHQSRHEHHRALHRARVQQVRQHLSREECGGLCELLELGEEVTVVRPLTRRLGCNEQNGRPGIA